MPSLTLSETHVRGVYLGDDGRVYAKEGGRERRCPACGGWAREFYRWADRRVCGRHVRVAERRLVRVTTTFALRVYGGAGGCPPGRVVRRGDVLAVAGAPDRVGRFDKFRVSGRAGFVLVPRSRWAWVR